MTAPRAGCAQLGPWRRNGEGTWVRLVGYLVAAIVSRQPGDGGPLYRCGVGVMAKRRTIGGALTVWGGCAFVNRWLREHGA